MSPGTACFLHIFRNTATSDSLATLTKMDPLVISPPFRWVTVVRVDILERNREVDKEKVKVVDALFLRRQ